MLDESVRRIVECGAMAPSADNCQPWRFSWDGRKLDLVNDGARGEHPLNFGGTASFVAFGAVLENMRIAAKALGVALSEELLPGGEAAPVIATVKLAETGRAGRHPLFEHIRGRCTNRKPYLPKPLDSNARELLSSVARESGFGELFLVEDPPQKDKAARAVACNDRLMFERRDIHDHVFKYIRWTRRQAEKTRDGLYIKTLELGLQGRLMRLTNLWPLVRALNLAGFSRFAAMHNYLLCRNSPAMGLIQARDRSPKSLIDGGRLLQRIWLTATAAGLSLQPETGILYLLQRLRRGGPDEFTDSQRSLLSGAERLLGSVFPLDPGKSDIMLFRLGYAPEPSARSLRRPVMEVLAKEL